MDKKGGFSDTKILFLTLVLFSISFMIYSALFSVATLDFGDATNITATSDNDGVDNGTVGGGNEIINLTISGLGTTGDNITHINITLPAGNYTFLNFISGGGVIEYSDNATGGGADDKVGGYPLTNVSFYPDGTATTWGCYNDSATTITCNTTEHLGTDGTDALGGGANNTLIITFNVTAASDVTEQIANIQIDVSNGTVMNETSTNTTVVNLTIDGSAPRLLDINITDGNTTLLNETAILNLSVTDIIPGANFLSKNASNITVTLAIQEHAIDTILFYYNCTSETNNVSQTVGAFFNPEGQGGVKANYSYKSDRGAGTSGVVIATETVAYTGIVDSTCFNGVAAANITTLTIVINDTFGNSVQNNLSGVDGPTMFRLNTTADGTPTVYSINVTDATNTLSTRDTMDGGSDYLQGGNHTFEIEVSTGSSVNMTEVVLVYNTTSTVTLGANGFYDNAADNVVVYPEVHNNSELEAGTKTVLRAAVNFGSDNDTTIVSFGWVINATGNTLGEDDALYTISAGPFSYQIDSSLPAATLTMPAQTSIDVRATIKFTCTGTDSTSGVKEYKTTVTRPDATTVVKTTSVAGTEVSFTGDDTNQAGDYTVECKVTDNAANEKATTSSFSATYATAAGAGGGGGGGGGAGGAAGVSFDVDFSQATVTEASIEVAEGSSRTFSFDGQTTHTLRVDSIADNAATVTISSTPQTFVLNVGESRKVDVNQDGLDDIEVTLNSIDNGVADLSIKKIEEGAAAVAEEEKAAAEEAEETGAAPAEGVAPEPVAQTGYGTMIAVIVIIVIIIGLVVYYFMRKK
ncbi:hypothetical protein HYX17_04280 [Candidatus Woesearchaeota archaeon]|nr:hypothetical protein [Candidatus Woesearchaeota archaeon]